MLQKYDICYFCNERSHKSTECKKYKTERSRKTLAKRKNICHSCFIKSDRTHPPANKECPTNENCNGWYSTIHHSVFCPERIEELKKVSYFLPKIDEDLFARFMSTWEIDEKYLMGMSSPFAQKIIPLKNIKVIEGIGGRFEDPEHSDSTIFVVTMEFYISKTDDENIEKFKKNEIICKSRKVSLYDMKISAKELLQMFSSITKEIYIEKLNSEVTFSDIIKRVPNIEFFGIGDNSLKVKDETWIKDLFKYKNGKNFNFRELYIHLDTVEFDIGKLKEFIITKCVKNVAIGIQYASGLPKERISDFTNEIGKNFFEVQHSIFECKPNIKISITEDNFCKYFTLDIEQVNSMKIPKGTRKRLLDSD